MAETKMTVLKDGPIRVEGGFSLTDAAGEPFDLGGRAAVALCRCGHSQNKPFCDGSHKAAGFQSEVKAKA